MRHSLFAFLMTLSTPALAGGIEITNPVVPAAPPGVSAHAGFMTLTNSGETTRSLINVSATGYHMAHIHMSEEKDGIATMSAVHQLDIAPGQTVMFEHGGLHVMLMHPTMPVTAGDDITLTLTFADGEEVIVTAPVMKMHMHDHGS